MCFCLQHIIHAYLYFGLNGLRYTEVSPHPTFCEKHLFLGNSLRYIYFILCISS